MLPPPIQIHILPFLMQHRLLTLALMATSLSILNIFYSTSLMMLLPSGLLFLHHALGCTGSLHTLQNQYKLQTPAT